MKCTPIFSVEDLSRLAWGSCRDGYPRRTLNRKPLPPIHELAHRVVAARIIGRALTAGEIIDHANGEVLDCRRVNLRLTDATGNSQNRRDGTGFRGTTWHKQARKWQATVGYRRRQFYLGLFSDRTAAAMAAAQKRRDLNFLSLEVAK